MVSVRLLVRVRVGGSRKGKRGRGKIESEMGFQGVEPWIVLRLQPALPSYCPSFPGFIVALLTASGARPSVPWIWNVEERGGGKNVPSGWRMDGQPKRTRTVLQLDVCPPAQLTMRSSLLLFHTAAVSHRPQSWRGRGERVKLISMCDRPLRRYDINSLRHQRAR